MIVEDFKVTFSKHLEDWNYVAANQLLSDPVNKEWLEVNAAFELMPLVMTYLTPEQEEKGAHMVQGCSQLLKQLAGFGSPKESLIALIEHCEAFENSVKYRNVLPALSLTMERIHEDSKTRKRLYLTWDWTLDTLTNHIRALILPEISDCCLTTTEERLLLDSDPDMAQLVDTIREFNSVLDLMARQVVNAAEDDDDDDVGGRRKCERILVRACMAVLGKPLVSLNLELHNSKRSAGQSKSTARRVAETLVGHVTNLEADVLSLTDHERSKAKYLFEDQDWILATGTLFSVVFDDCHVADPSQRKDFILSIPSCYNPTFVLHSLLPSINAMMLPSANQLSVLKALGLSRDVMSRISKGILTSCVLEMDRHSDFLKHLMRVIVYNTVENVRKDAYRVFDQYFGLYRLSGGRYRLITVLLEIANHSGLIGYAISKAKDGVLESMKDAGYGKEEAKSDFAGHNLKVLVRKFTKLSNGAETDLLEISDELMAGINFLVCVYLRDSVDRNASGIWDVKKDLQDNFIATLETGLNMARAHYKEKLLQDGEDGSVVAVEGSSITVGGQELPTLTSDQRKSVLVAALNTFDMIQCVLMQLKDILDRK